MGECQEGRLPSQIQLVLNIANKQAFESNNSNCYICFERQGNLRAHEKATDEGREGSNLTQKTQYENLHLNPHTFFSGARGGGGL